ncbi:MAG TPA: hypothetical protein VHD32_18625 [Candidatus Didemnitutus sp.]|nr:hypothetical protein [Candidatus Didemnitutus sp.]
MKHRLLLVILAAATVAFTMARADDEDDEDDQEFDYFSYFSRAHHNLTFGFRATQGAKVKFGNVGIIPSPTPAAAFSSDATANNVTRAYDNGVVAGDTYRNSTSAQPSEYDANGNVYSKPYQYYISSAPQVDANGVPVVLNGSQLTATTGQSLGYTPGTTRYYSIATPLQTANPGSVYFTQYSVDTEGASLNGHRNLSGGVELQAERLFTDPSKRFRFSLLAGVSLNGINSKQTGTVKSRLHILTDTYTFASPQDSNGVSLGVTSLPSTAAYPYTTPDTIAKTYTDALGNVQSYPYEQQPYLNIPTTGASRTETDTEDGADVDGIWEIKGSYLVFKVGPEVGANVTPNLTLNASAGFAAAYVGTNYSAIESTTIDDPTLSTPTITTGAVTSEVSKFLPGYYANLDASWSINERSGLFAGLAYESFTDYTQTNAGRSAKIDLGGNASLRGGLSIKF